MKDGKTNYLSIKGTTTIEVVVALILFSLAAAGLALAVPMAYNRARIWRDQSNLAWYLEQHLEEIRGQPFTDLIPGDSGLLDDGDFKFRQVTTYVITGTDSTGRPTWEEGTSGTGLSASYFDNRDLTGTPIRRIDPRIDFDWNIEPPDPALNRNNFSTRWQGFLKVPEDGSYTFYTTTDDGVRLWVNNQLLIDHWESGFGVWNASISLKAGENYPLKMEYFQHSQEAEAHLSWSGPSIPKQIIEPQYLNASSVKMTVVTVSNPAGSITLEGRVLTFDQDNSGTITPTSTVYIAAITMATLNHGSKWQAIAVITVFDGNGQPLSGVSVDCAWSGLVTGNTSGLTNSNGKVNLYSVRTKNSGEIRLTVNNLRRANYIYDSPSNLTDSNSITGP